MTGRTVAEEDSYTVEQIAKTVVWATSSGCCEYGKVCDLCDCFADGDGGKYRDQCARAAGRAAVAEWRRQR